VDITGSSTYCLDILSQAIKGRKYKKIKQLKLREIKFNLEKDSIMKKSGQVKGTEYREYLYDKDITQEKLYNNMARLSTNLINLKE